MEIPDGHFRHILLYYLRKGKNAVQARKKLYDVYGEKWLTERQCQNWFARFRSWDFDLKDAPRSGRPTEVGNDKIKAIIENNRRSTTQEIAEKLNISHFKGIVYFELLPRNQTINSNIYTEKLFIVKFSIIIFMFTKSQ